MKNKTFLLVLFAAFSMAMSAQITGTVLEDATDFPVIGASVVEVGTTNGVITDFDGNFELNVAEGTQIQISYMGFAAQTLAAKNGMIVRLAEDTHVLQEVVAIGYGSQKKKEVTGSVASIKAEDFNAGVKSNPVGLLQGKVAGLNISRTTSDPTSTGYNIQIRGFSTLGQGTGSAPLYIVDGVPTSNIDNIAPDEIASMDVLKDGSAAAIYGTRGTNGVILITTKRGEGHNDNAQTQLEYSGYMNVSWINSRVGMANADDPTGYGRIIKDSWGKFIKIVEQKDATEEEQRVKEINSGMYIFNSDILSEALSKLTNDNAQGEYYLTDTIEIVKNENLGEVATMVIDDIDEIKGVNSPEQLQEAEDILKKREGK